MQPRAIAPPRIAIYFFKLVIMIILIFLIFF